MLHLIYQNQNLMRHIAGFVPVPLHAFNQQSKTYLPLQLLDNLYATNQHKTLQMLFRVIRIRILHMKPVLQPDAAEAEQCRLLITYLEEAKNYTTSYTSAIILLNLIFVLETRLNIAPQSDYPGFLALMHDQDPIDLQLALLPVQLHENNTEAMIHAAFQQLEQISINRDATMWRWRILGKISPDPERILATFTNKIYHYAKRYTSMNYQIPLEETVIFQHVIDAFCAFCDNEAILPLVHHGILYALLVAVIKFDHLVELSPTIKHLIMHYSENFIDNPRFILVFLQNIAVNPIKCLHYLQLVAKKLPTRFRTLEIYLVVTFINNHLDNSREVLRQAMLLLAELAQHNAFAERFMTHILQFMLQDSLFISRYVDFYEAYPEILQLQGSDIFSRITERCYFNLRHDGRVQFIRIMLSILLRCDLNLLQSTLNPIDMALLCLEKTVERERIFLPGGFSSRLFYQTFEVLQKLLSVYSQQFTAEHVQELKLYQDNVACVRPFLLNLAAKRADLACVIGISSMLPVVRHEEFIPAIVPADPDNAEFMRFSHARREPLDDELPSEPQCNQFVGRFTRALRHHAAKEVLTVTFFANTNAFVGWLTGADPAYCSIMAACSYSLMLVTRAFFEAACNSQNYWSIEILMPHSRKFITKIVEFALAGVLGVAGVMTLAPGYSMDPLHYAMVHIMGSSIILLSTMLVNGILVRDELIDGLHEEYLPLTYC